MGWGDNNRVQLGIGDSTVGNVVGWTTKVQGLNGVDYLNYINSISAGFDHSLSGQLQSEENFYSWGSNDYEKLGNGTNVSYSSVPVNVIEPMADLIVKNFYDPIVECIPKNHTEICSLELNFEIDNIGLNFVKYKIFKVTINQLNKDYRLIKVFNTFTISGYQI